MTRTLAALAIAALALAGCSGSSSSSTTTTTAAATPAPAPTNPVDFPLVAGATIVATKTFTQKVDASQMKSGAGAFSQGSGTYAGEQVIAKSDASLDDLTKWLGDQTAHPPAGYSAVEISGADMARAHTMARQYGIDFAAFQKSENGKRHGVLLLAMDPSTLDARLGGAIGMIGKYASLPAMLRQPVDDQVKARTGMTVSELLDPGAPLGAALSAYDTLKTSGSRAVVLVDATKL